MHMEMHDALSGSLIDIAEDVHAGCICFLHDMPAQHGCNFHQMSQRFFFTAQKVVVMLFRHDQRMSFGHLGKIKKSILNMKLRNKRRNADFFSAAMTAVLKEELEHWEIDVIAPIPLHPKKRRCRGFNQAELLAVPLGEALKIPVIPDLLKKKEETSEQKELDRKSRQKNLKKAFKIGPYDVKLSRVLLVDDIFTTGSTVDAAAAVLKEAGAEAVFFLTACIGTEREDRTELVTGERHGKRKPDPDYDRHSGI